MHSSVTSEYGDAVVARWRNIHASWRQVLENRYGVMICKCWYNIMWRYSKYDEIISKCGDIIINKGDQSKAISMELRCTPLPERGDAISLSDTTNNKHSNLATILRVNHIALRFRCKWLINIAIMGELLLFLMTGITKEKYGTNSVVIKLESCRQKS